jgi:hypothetical protein
MKRDSLLFLEARIILSKADPGGHCLFVLGSRNRIIDHFTDGCYHLSANIFAVTRRIECTAIPMPLRERHVQIGRAPMVWTNKRRDHQIPAHKRERGSVVGFHALGLPERKVLIEQRLAVALRAVPQAQQNLAILTVERSTKPVKQPLIEAMDCVLPEP